MTTCVFVEKRCPNCGKTGSTVQIASTNGFGATTYTDGCVRGGVYDPGVSLLRCRGCDAYCWWDESETLALSDLPFGDDGSEYLFAPVRKDDWLAALAAEAWRTPGQERMIRQNVWWVHNDPYRQNPGLAFAADESALANARRLLALLSAENCDREAEDDLLKAEVLRYLGHMDACLEQLDAIGDPNFSEPVATIRQLATQGKRQVAEVPIPQAD